MGLLKLTGSVLIILSTSMIGYHYGNKYSNRLKNLIYLEQCLRILETEIVYGAIPLPEALDNVYKKGNKKVSFIFGEIASELFKQKHSNISDAFLMVIPLMKDKLQLRKEDTELFLALGGVLGSSGRLDQEKNFRLILNQISVLQTEARLERDKNERVYKTLGILTGTTILIILF